MPKLFIAYNAAPPTTAAPVKMTTGAVIKTLLQVATPSTTYIEIVEYGISFDGNAAATPVNCELVQTDVAATGGTSFTPQSYNLVGDAVASLCVGGASATCFGPSTEGTTTATRMLDWQLIAPTNQFVKQWPLGLYPLVPVSKFLRIRVTAPASVGAACYVVWQEG